MKEKQLLKTVGINISDWDSTPIRVRNLVVQQRGKIEQLEQRLTELEVSGKNLQEADWSWQSSRSWCQTGQVKRRRKSGIVEVNAPDSQAKKI